MDMVDMLRKHTPLLPIVFASLLGGSLAAQSPANDATLKVKVRIDMIEWDAEVTEK